jgi:hypothetical protein
MEAPMSLPNDSQGPVSIDRREFTVEALMAVLAGYVITVSEACGSKSTPTQPGPTVSDITGTISANHGHTAVVSAGMINAGAAVNLPIQGTATHPHLVAISAADFANLKNRQTVTITSSLDNNHTHVVTFTPA